MKNEEQIIGRITQQDGVRTTVCENRFEVLIRDNAEVPEQQTVQALREWIRGRKAKTMQDAGSVSG